MFGDITIFGFDDVVEAREDGFIPIVGHFKKGDIPL